MIALFGVRALAATPEEKAAVAERTTEIKASTAAGKFDKADALLKEQDKATQALPAGDPDKAAAQDAAKNLDEAKNTAGCGAGDSASWCLFGGAFIASYSLTLAASERDGQTSHHVVSLLTPELGARYIVSRYVGFDMGLYTSIVSPELNVNTLDTTGTGCAKKSTAFEDKLPCEGNAVLRPYIAAIAGFTLGTGSSSFGVLTLGVTGGLARTTQDATGAGFIGLMIGSGGVYTTVPLNGKSSK